MFTEPLSPAFSNSLYIKNFAEKGPYSPQVLNWLQEVAVKIYLYKQEPWFHHWLSETSVHSLFGAIRYFCRVSYRDAQKRLSYGCVNSPPQSEAGSRNLGHTFCTYCMYTAVHRWLNQNRIPLSGAQKVAIFSVAQMRSARKRIHMRIKNWSTQEKEGRPTIGRRRRRRRGAWASRALPCLGPQKSFVVAPAQKLTHPSRTGREENRQDRHRRRSTIHAHDPTFPHSFSHCGSFFKAKDNQGSLKRILGQIGSITVQNMSKRAEEPPSPRVV